MKLIINGETHFTCGHQCTLLRSKTPCKACGSTPFGYAQGTTLTNQKIDK